MKRIGIGLVAVAIVLSAQPVGAKRQPARTASADEYASLVAEYTPPVSDAIEGVTDHCMLLPICDEIGAIDLYTLSITTDTLNVVLDGADDRAAKNEGYIGSPPKKLRRLVQRTVDAASKVSDEANFAEAVCRTSNPARGLDCPGALGDLLGPMSSLDGVIDAWGPYLS